MPKLPIQNALYVVCNLNYTPMYSDIEKDRDTEAQRT